MDLNSLVKQIKKIEVNTNNPTVIYSSIWQLKFLYKKSPDTICKYLFREIIKLSKKKDILIPAFINPKKLQNINIGKKKILTGYLAEYLAKKRSFYRTLNPFFSFLIIGPNKKKLISKSAKYEWGDGSLYDWLYKKNANIITIGTHPTNCSFSHYAEQKMKNIIHNYYIQ